MTKENESLLAILSNMKTVTLPNFDKERIVVAALQAANKTVDSKKS